MSNIWYNHVQIYNAYKIFLSLKIAFFFGEAFRYLFVMSLPNNAQIAWHLGKAPENMFICKEVPSIHDAGK